LRLTPLPSSHLVPYTTLFRSSHQLANKLANTKPIPTINSSVKENNQSAKFVICSENSKKYYNEIIRLDNKYFNILNMNDDNITTHPEVSQNTVLEQFMLRNMILTEFSFKYKILLYEASHISFWDAFCVFNIRSLL